MAGTLFLGTPKRKVFCLVGAFSNVEDPIEMDELVLVPSIAEAGQTTLGKCSWGSVLVLELPCRMQLQRSIRSLWKHGWLYSLRPFTFGVLRKDLYRLLEKYNGMISETKRPLENTLKERLPGIHEMIPDQEDLFFSSLLCLSRMKCSFQGNCRFLCESGSFIVVLDFIVFIFALGVAVDL